MPLRCTPCSELDCLCLQVKTVAEVNNVDVSEAVKDLEVRAEQVSCCLLCFLCCSRDCTHAPFMLWTLVLPRMEAGCTLGLHVAGEEGSVPVATHSVTRSYRSP